jgi:protein involved in polysaccharide export with SLBB domain
LVNARLPLCLVVAATTVLAVACGSSSPPRNTPPVVAPLPDATRAVPIITNHYVLDAGDEVELRFPYRPEFNTVAKVRPDGKLTLPFIGSLAVVGCAPDDVQTYLTSAYHAISYQPEGTKAGERHYLISVDDELEVRFAYADSLNEKVTVRPDGKVSLPLVKSIQAEGRTPEDFQEELKRLYAPFVRDSDLVVIVRNATNGDYVMGGQRHRPGPKQLYDPLFSVRTYIDRQVYVGGEVGRPSFLSYQPRLTALQAIIAAGGLKRTAELKSVVVLRKLSPQEARVITFNLEPAMKGQSNTDLPLQPYDVVLVPQTTIAKINDFVDQYVYQLIPGIRNTNFAFVYNLRDNTINTR